MAPLSWLGKMKSPIALGLVVLAGIGAIGAVAWIRAPGPEDRFEAYLRAVAGGEPDRGWHYLTDDTRDVGYQNDQSVYLRDAAAADWTAFRWSDAAVVWTDDGFAAVEVNLLSSPSSVPAFLIAKKIVRGVCAGDDQQPIGVGVYADDRLLGSGGFGAGGLSGTQIACNGHFRGEEGAATETPAGQATNTPHSTPTATDLTATICVGASGSVTDVSTEPDWRRYGDYRPWTTADGCLVRIDVLADRPGPAHCGWEAARVIIAAIPIGARYSNESNDANYVRDPDNVAGAQRG
jgi:hypothetical protein